MSDHSDTAALIIANDAAVRDSLAVLLEAYGLPVKSYGGAAECLREHDAAEKSRLVIIYQKTSAQGLDFIRELRRVSMSLPAIVLAARIDPTSRQEAARFGTIIVETPPDEGALCQAIEMALGSGIIRA